MTDKTVSYIYDEVEIFLNETQLNSYYLLVDSDRQSKCYFYQRLIIKFFQNMDRYSNALPQIKYTADEIKYLCNISKDFSHRIDLIKKGEYNND